ncbi:MAG TPA: UvrD-helicase domain-containing protein, partial [Bacteroidales bacterium]|nr:UvrD-helicase domain-containing protein [Bacteroidales bacterium]
MVSAGGVRLFCIFTWMSFTVYRSSAGSGKTYTLVKEYLGIVLQDPFLFRNILAITFTNKAANEMRERILSSLRDIANPQENPDSSVVRNMLPDLVGITGLAPEEVSRQATVVLGNILHNYQDFSVGTIDSFIHRIIRTFAFDLHLPLNFEVEMDEQAMVGMAVDLLLGRVGIDKVPTDILKKFTESRIDDEKNWDVEKDLKSFAAKLLRDDIAQFLPVLEKMETSDIIAASEELLKYMKWFETEGQRQASSIIDIWQENDIAPEDLSYGKNGIYGYVRRLANGDFSKLTANNYVVATLGEDKWTSTKADGAKVAVINSIKTVLLQKAADLVNHVDNGKRRYIFYRLLKKNIFPLAVLHEIIAVMQQIREAEGIIHISEFDKRIAGVVGSEPVPFIYERLGDRYSHFLIDEFQDTSVLEWQNLLPLIENSLAEGKFNMVVGDAKQAIYRFKGGEVEQLVKLPEIYKKALTSEMIARERQLHDHYDDRKLQSNYRSRENVIGFNNAFYTFISTLLSGMLKDIYADCFQQSSGNSPGGEVRIHFIDQEGRKEDKEPVYFEQIRNYIGEMVQEHGYALRDIAILTRSNSSASKIARNLLLNGTNVISAESLLLSSSPEVNFLINCLDFITNSDNKLALANMLSFIVQRDGRELHPSMAELLSGKDKDTESLHRLQSYFIKAGIHFNREELSQMGLYERVEGLIRIFSLDNTLNPYLMFFLDAVYDYSMNKRFIDEDFTSYWRENSNKFSIVVPEGLDAVNVMTIHKAKGLEFPVVIYPFANSKVDIFRDKKWITIDDPRLPGLKAALIPLINDLSDTDYADYL